MDYDEKPGMNYETTGEEVPMWETTRITGDVLAFTFLYLLVLTRGWPELQNGAGDADIKKPEKVSTVIPQYLQGTDPRSPRDSKIQGGSSPLYKTV